MVGRMTSLGLPRGAASANGSEGPMSVTVARTGSGWPEATTGRLTVRVTHTLPFPAARPWPRTSATTAPPAFRRVVRWPAAWAKIPRAAAHGQQPPRPPSPQPTAAVRTSVRSHACRRADHPPTACRHAAWPMQATAFHTRSVGLNTESYVRGPAALRPVGLNNCRTSPTPYGVGRGQDRAAILPNAVRRGANRHQMLRPA